METILQAAILTLLLSGLVLTILSMISDKLK
jgi:hypothetical protein